MRARSKKRKRPSLFFRVLTLLVLLLVILAGLYYFLSLPIWKITRLSVDGAQILSADEIRNLSGIPLSENIFFTNFVRARENLQKITAIKDFHLFRVPPGTVLIRIYERKPVAVLVLKNRSAIVDKEGFILNWNSRLTLNIPHLTDLPVISGIGTEEAGKEEKINPRISALLSEIILELSNLNGSRQIQLETGGFKKISFLLNDILRVKIGRDEEIRKKITVFKRLLPVIANKWEQVEYVDVRFPNNPVIKFR